MKAPNFHQPRLRRLFRRQRGFALILVLSMMVLLTVIALGLLTLSTISLRSSEQSADMAVAKGNARMALMLAIGELQKNTGLDTRITARADILNATNSPAILGVWKSSEGTDHNASGMPVIPTGYYDNHKQNKFLEWLTSSSIINPSMGTLPATVAGGSSSIPGSARVGLLGAGSVGSTDAANRQVFLDPVPLTTSPNTYTGSMAWWVGGENQKARMPKPYEPVNTGAAGWATLVKSHPIADPKGFNLENVLTQSGLSDPTTVTPSLKAVSMKEVDLVNPSSTAVSKDSYHDLSATSIGMLTNSATGGWRKDMSLASENWSSISAPPMFRATPTTDLIFGMATSSDYYSKHSLPYYWADYRRSSNNNNAGIYNSGAVCSWTNMVYYTTMYKQMTAATGVGTLNPNGYDVFNSAASYLHQVRIMPLVARVQWIYSHRAVAISATQYKLQLLVQPVVTFWNPYNVKLAAISQTVDVQLVRTPPPVITYTVGGTVLPRPITLVANSLSASSTTRNVQGLVPAQSVYNITQIPAFAPGETRVFSVTSITDQGSYSQTLTPGYTPGNGQALDIATLTLPGSAQISTDVEFNGEYSDSAGGAPCDGVGVYMDMHYGGALCMAYRMSYKKALADAAYPKMDRSKFPATSTLASAASAPISFLSVIFGNRMASNTNLPSKGFLQASPFVSYTAMGGKSAIEPGILYPYPGVLHNVNSPFEYNFTALDGTGRDAVMPEVDQQKRGFIMTGYKSATGLSRCVIDEVPTRPIVSLGELQNWDARYDNPVPPYSFNLIGNSDATPLIPSNSVSSASLGVKGEENLQYDDSYCLNHVLFDDWFFSSIATDPANFGAPASSSSPRKVYTDFLTVASKPLTNRAYKALPADVAAAAVSASAASTLASKNVGTAATSWKTIASRLEVEGMFNVNSTSVKAWRALLGHARNEKIPYFDSSGNILLSASTDHASSRFSIAGDVESGQTGSSGTRTDSAQFTGYRILTDSQLDLLAQEIVNQVRARGPFLSLSEFVNRQLSSGNLALAGAVQTALNKLATSTQNPYAVLQTNTAPAPYTNIATATPPPSDSQYPTDYKYTDAATGYSLYGLPGWTRQADIIRPLAPIMSVRDDTFTIRAYGDARDSTGKTIKARAVCEAVVRRTKDYVDPSDDPAVVDLSSSTGTVVTKKTVNTVFGRHFDIVSFRWLSPGEV